MKKAGKIILFTAIVAVLAVILTACGLLGGGTDSGKTTTSNDPVPVEKMKVKGEIAELYYSSEIDMICWTNVTDATYYIVTVNNEAPTTTYNCAYSNIPRGDCTFSVVAVRNNNTKTATKTANFTHRTVGEITIDNVEGKASWTAVEGATGYKVTLTPSYGDRIEKTVTTTYFELTDVNDSRTYSLAVKPILQNGLVTVSYSSFDNIQRARVTSFYYNGNYERFEGGADSDDTVTYTNHLQIGDAEPVTFTGRLYPYVPTQDVEIKYYATSDKSNVLRSETVEFTIDYIEPIDNLTFDGTTFMWGEEKSEENEGAYDYYFIYFEKSADLRTGVQVQGQSYAVTMRDVAAGSAATAYVVPNAFFNQYASRSNEIKIYRRGAQLELNFETSEYRLYGSTEEGKNIFSLTGGRYDEALVAEGGGFRLTLTGAEETVVDLPTEENAYTASYGGFLFETPGEYTITATLLYDLDEDVVLFGDELTSTYTITRAAPLTEVELVSYETNPYLKCKGTIGFIDRIDTKGGVTADPIKVDLKNARVIDGYTYIGLPKENDSQKQVEYSVTVYSRADKISLYDYTSWQRSQVRSMTLRSLTGQTVTYKVNGTVKMDTLSLNGFTNKMVWDYDEGWCSDLYKTTFKANNGKTLYTLYDDCNPFGLIAGIFGDVDSIGKHTEQSAPEATITAFDNLATLFATFMANYSVPTDGSDYMPSVTGSALTDYTAFYNKAIEIYNDSMLTFTKNLGGDVSKGALIGLNRPYSMVFGGGINPSQINLQTLAANLFGFASASDFAGYAQDLADLCESNETVALENGSFYTENGFFIFPIAVKNNLYPTVLTYVIVGSDGLVSVWLNDVVNALKATHFNEDYDTIFAVENKLYCKNLLFVTGRLAVETLISMTYKDAEGKTHRLETIRTLERELDFTDYADEGTFLYGGTVMIWIGGDPNNNVFSCAQARTKSITQLPAPVLNFYASTTDYLLAKAQRNESMDTEGYKTGDADSIDDYDIIGGGNVQFTEDHIGQEIKFRYRSLSNFVLRSMWSTYTVEAPATGSAITLNSGTNKGVATKTISWTAKDNYTSYKYSITGGMTKEETVDVTYTANLSTALQNAGRSTFNIRVEAIGHIEGNVVYFQKRIVDEDFCTVKLEATRLKREGSDEVDHSKLAYNVAASPDSVAIHPLYLTVTVRNTGNTVKRMDSSSQETSNLDLTSMAEQVAAEMPGGANATKYLVVSIEINMNEDTILRNKAFLLNNRFVQYVDRYPNNGSPTYSGQ